MEGGVAVGQVGESACFLHPVKKTRGGRTFPPTSVLDQ